jgi:hypothetical protein
MVVASMVAVGGVLLQLFVPDIALDHSIQSCIWSGSSVASHILAQGSKVASSGCLAQGA